MDQLFAPGPSTPTIRADRGPLRLWQYGLYAAAPYHAVDVILLLTSRSAFLYLNCIVNVRKHFSLQPRL
jgi:hypothetical protein